MILRNRWFYVTQIIIDILIIDISYYLGFIIQRPEIFQNGIPEGIIVSLIYITFLSLIFLLTFKIYKCGQKEFSLIVFYLLICLPLIAIFSVITDFLIKGIGIWRRTIFYALIIQIPSFLLVKLLIYKIYRSLVKPIDCIIIGKNHLDGAKLFLKAYNKKNSIFKVNYILEENNNNLFEYISKNSQVIIDSSCKRKTEIMEYCAVNNKDCKLIPSFTDILINSGKFININDIMFYDMKIKMDLEVRIIKRVFDILFSGFALLILSPLILFVSILIKINDHGKIIYAQKRLTKGNQEFMVYKFRTMKENAENKTGPVLAKSNDKRVTKVGKFLRSTRIDEVPQFLNVLKGDMSVIGPRPERPELISKTINDIPEFAYRTLVKAGITGLAQTMGKYNTTFEDKLRFDLYYVNNYSLLLDLKILFYTLHTIFTPSAAEGLDDKDDEDSLLEEINNLGINIT